MRSRMFLLVVAVACIGAAAFGAAPASGAGEHHEETFLGLPSWIWKLANMLLFFAVLWWAIKGPVRRGLEERRQAIRNAAEEASKRRERSEQIAGEIQAKLRQIDEEIRAIHQRAQQDGERQKRELIAAGEAEAAKILQAARNEIDNRLKHARQELTEYAGQLAADRAAAILEQRITDDDRARLFRSGLREVEEVKP